MYKLNYFQKDFDNANCISFKMYSSLLSDNKIDQPIIFCDKHYIDPLNNIPIFHSYFINQHYHLTDILTDYDQITYLDYFNNKNFLVVYNPDTQDINKYKDIYKFIDINTNIDSYMEQMYGKL